MGRAILGWALVLIGLALGAFALVALAGPPVALGLSSGAQLLALQTQTLVVASTSIIVGTILLSVRNRSN